MSIQYNIETFKRWHDQKIFVAKDDIINYIQSQLDKSIEPDRILIRILEELKNIK